MKLMHIIGLFCIVAVFIVFSGCARSDSPCSNTHTRHRNNNSSTGTGPTTYPGALALNQEVPFGVAGMNGTATVYKAETRSTYSWASPSYNSPHEQQQAGDSLYTTQKGYNTEKPKDGNTFLFVYVRLTNTGSARMVAPSPTQFIVTYGGKTYPYSSVRGSDVTVSTVRVNQYDYQIGRGGVAGSILPGGGNAADGFLIYEVPSSINLKNTALIIALDPEHQSAWKLG